MKISEEKFIKHFDEIMLDKKMDQDEKWNQIIWARVRSIQAAAEEK